MEMAGLVLLGIGVVLYLIGGIWFLVAAFKQSIWWGLGTLFVPFVGLIFLFVHWSKAGKPFLLSLLGVVLLVGGAAMSGQLSQERLDSLRDPNITIEQP